MEQEQGYTAVMRGDQISQRAGAANTRVNLTEIWCAIVGVEQEVHAEYTLVTFLVEAIAESNRHVTKVAASFGIEYLWPDVVAAPATLIGCDFLETGDIGLDRADQGTVSGHANFDCSRHVVNSLHNL